MNIDPQNSFLMFATSYTNHLSRNLKMVVSGLCHPACIQALIQASMHKLIGDFSTMNWMDSYYLKT